MSFVVPEAELEELADVLDSGKLELLRDRYETARRIKQPLEMYTSRIWLFPFGVHPSSRHPVQVFRNGLAQWMNHEVKLFKVGSRRPLTVAVFQRETRPGDRVQATYIAVESP
jgi:hypothetical protein